MLKVMPERANEDGSMRGSRVNFSDEGASRSHTCIPPVSDPTSEPPGMAPRGGIRRGLEHLSTHISSGNSSGKVSPALHSVSSYHKSKSGLASTRFKTDTGSLDLEPHPVGELQNSSSAPIPEPAICKETSIAGAPHPGNPASLLQHPMPAAGPDMCAQPPVTTSAPAAYHTPKAVALGCLEAVLAACVALASCSLGSKPDRNSNGSAHSRQGSCSQALVPSPPAPPPQHEQGLSWLAWVTPRALSTDDAWWPYWNQLCVAAAVATGFTAPFTMAFVGMDDLSVLSWDVMEFFLVGIFCGDIVISFFLEYDDPDTGLPVSDLRLIMKHYLGGMFTLDVLFTLPWEKVVQGMLRVEPDTTTWLLIGLLRLLALGRLYRITSYVAGLEYRMVLPQTALILLRNNMYILFSCHLAGMVFYLIARLEHFRPESWVGRNYERFDGLSLTGRYIYSLYFSMAAFSGLGDNDFYVASVPEAVVMLVYLLFNLLLGAYILGTVTMLLTKGDKRMKLFRDRVTNLRSYGKINELPQRLMTAMEAHVELHFQSEQASDEQVLAIFPQTIRRRVLRHLYIKPIKECHLFAGCKPKYLDAVLAAGRVELFMPREQIIADGDIVNEIIVLLEGEVESCVAGAPPAHLRAGARKVHKSRSGPSQAMLHRIKSRAAEGAEEKGGGRESYEGMRQQYTSKKGRSSTQDFNRQSTSLPLTAGSVTMDKAPSFGRTSSMNFSEAGSDVSMVEEGALSAAPSSRRTRKQQVAEDGFVTRKEPGAAFGAISFFTELPSQESVWSSSVIKVLVLNRTAFQELLTAFPQQTRKMLQNLDDHTVETVTQELLDSLDASKRMSEDVVQALHLLAIRDVRPTDLTTSVLMEMRGLLKAHQRPMLDNMGKVKDALAKYVRKVDQEIVYEFLNNCSGGDEAAVRAALSGGMSPNAADYDKRTGLMLACHEGHAGLVRMLLEAGADPQLKDSFSGTAMWECVKMCHNEIIEILLEFGATLGMEGYAVSSQMCQFVREGDMVQLSRMLRAGANPNQLDYSSNSPLHVAVLCGNLTAAQLLVSEGSARVDFKDALGKTPYDEAVRLGNRPIMEFLKDLTDAAVSETAMLARNTDFLNACSSGNAATVTRMLKAGQDPDTANYDKRTGLMLACHGGHENIVTLLLTNGADPMKQDSANNTAMWEAVTTKRHAIIDLLLQYGGGLGMEGVAVSCTMGRLLLEEDLPMLQSLIKAKADPDIEDYLGHTPLHVAASLGNLHAVRLLVEDANACVDPVDLHGRTPLDCARSRSHWQLVEYLEPLTQAAAQGVIKSRDNAYGPPAVTLMGYFTRVVVPPKPAEPTHHQPLSPSRLSSQRLSPDPHGTSSLLSPFVVPKFSTTTQPSSVLRSSSKLVAFAADAQVVVSPHPASRPPAPAAVVVGSLLNQHQGGVEAGYHHTLPHQQGDLQAAHHAGNQAEAQAQAPGPRVPLLQLATVRDTAQLQGVEAFPGQLSSLTEGEEGHHSTAWPPGRPYGPGLTIPDPTIPCQTQTPLRHFGSVSGAHYPEQQGVLPSPSQASWGPGGGHAQLVGGGLPSPRGMTRLASVSPTTLLSTLPHGPAPFRLASLKQAQGGLVSGEPGAVEGPGAGELGELRTLPPWTSSGQLQLRGSLPGGAGAAHQHGPQRAGMQSGMGSPSLQGAGGSGLGQQGGPGGAAPAGSGRTRRGSVVLLGAAGGQANVAAMRRMRRNTTAVEGQGGQDPVQTRVSGYGEVASERGAGAPSGGWPGEEPLLPWMQSVPEGEASPGQAVPGMMRGEGWAGRGAAVGVGGPGAGPEQPSSWGPQHGPGGTGPRPESSPPPYPAHALRHSLANLLQQPSGSAPPSPHHTPPPAPTLSPHTSNPGWLAPPPGPSTSSPPRPPPAATAPGPHPTTQAPSSRDPPPAPHAAHASRASSPGPLPTVASRAASPASLAPQPLVWAHNPLSRGSPEPLELDQDSLEAVVALMGRGMRVTPPGTKAPAPLPQELGKQQLGKQQQVGGVGGQQGVGWRAGGTKLAFPADRYEAEGRGVEVEGRQQEGRQQQLGQQQQGRGNGEVTLAPRVAGPQPQDVKTPRLGLEQGQQGGGSATSGALPVQPPAAAPPPPQQQQQPGGLPQGSLVPPQAELKAGQAAAVGAAAGARGASPSPHAPSPVRASLLPGKVKVGTFPSSSPSPASSPTPSASSSFKKARQGPLPSSTQGQSAPEPYMTPDPTPIPGLGAAAAAGAVGQPPPGQAPAKDQGAASPPLHQARVPELPAVALSAGAPPSHPPPSPSSGLQHPTPLQPAQPSQGQPSPTLAPAHPTLDPVMAMTSRTSPSQQPWPRPGSQTGGSRMVRPALQAHDPEPGLDALDEVHL